MVFVARTVALVQPATVTAVSDASVGLCRAHAAIFRRPSSSLAQALYRENVALEYCSASHSRRTVATGSTAGFEFS